MDQSDSPDSNTARSTVQHSSQVHGLRHSSLNAAASRRPVKPHIRPAEAERLTDQDRYRPRDAEEEEFRRRLHDLIIWALRQLRDQAGEEIALAMAGLLDRDKWRLMTSVNVDGDGEPDAETLWYRVEVEVETDGSSCARPAGRRSGSARRARPRKPGGPRCSTDSAFPTTCRPEDSPP